jgi:non-ribosomal peptide synthetase component F
MSQNVRAKTVLELFHDRVAAFPDATAIVSQEETLTYGELTNRSDRIASYLIERLPRTGGLVTIEGTCSANFISTIVGVLKANAAYIPIDYHYPEERKAYIIEQSGMRLALTTSNGRYDSAAAEHEYVSVAGLLKSEESTVLAGGLPFGPSPQDLIYVIFTSGTTGNPNGVMVEHHSVAALV